MLILIGIWTQFPFTAKAGTMTNEPDSAYIFAYSTTKNSGRNGLHVAWSTDQEKWHAIGPEFRFLFCDYGNWGKEKRLITPFLRQGPDGRWHCVWSLNEYDGTFAYASSKDLIHWTPQSYPMVMTNNNCLEPELSCNDITGSYTITWLSNAAGKTQVYSTTTTDFKSYSPTREVSRNQRINTRKQVAIDGNTEVGTISKVPWRMIDQLIKKQELSAYREQLWSENSKNDSARFSSLKSLEATITVDGSKSKKISDMLIGVFFEDINYAADGGLYAELVQNRDFEYLPEDRKGRDKSWNSYKAWRLDGNEGTLTIDTIAPIHPNNPHYAVLKIASPGKTGLVNEGFDGISVKEGEKYNLTIFVRNPDNKRKKLVIRIAGKNGEIAGETTVQTNSTEWEKKKAVLTAGKTIPDARMEIIPQNAGTINLDMISLFPQKTFKGRENGLRADLARTIADLHPRFVRFPGGCVAHGDGIANIYRWKNTIGPLESRKPQRNLWGYHQTAGLGYYEYFQFCEDIGAEPVPVLAAGVPCQNSSTGGAGQQGGIPMCDMDNYVQDVLDLIEWANGDTSTKWGKKRAEEGHPKPFNLKYIGIGNEDLITDIFEERFTMIYQAIREKYPEITVIGTVGPTFEGTDYEEGWKIATKLGVPMVDEHYYQSPGWFIYNQDFYDKYDRSKAKVYLGEYAAHLPGRPSNIETALAEALYLTALERNGDVVEMTSYAPLLAKKGHTQWKPDLIFFDNTNVMPTTDYFVQKLYGENQGDTYLPEKIKLSDNRMPVRNRVAVSVVRDSKSNDLIIKMVNMLPVSIKTHVTLNNTGDVQSVATCTTLSGKPDDRNVTPVTKTIGISKEFPCTLPAYSLTVIRAKSKSVNN